uniref:non-specific serine/threonine protein kinase n=1 Tax=Aureoumbra lagunensis TaxID=44058 RepID=A0A7S3JYF4_9STRA|mmetsp:Transcript_21413/g.32846  ORF Transcript_21413/g.32846 Transcript_21413/m.32846 type:complete len:1041 (+) Transcript_21413:65-3187(+)
MHSSTDSPSSSTLDSGIDYPMVTSQQEDRSERLVMHHFPTIPLPLVPIEPLVKEADILMETLISLSDERRYEAQMVAYCCLSYAIWLGQSCSTNTEECIEYLNILHIWQGRLRPESERFSSKFDEEKLSANVCEFLGSVICQQQNDDHKLNYLKKPPLERCIISTGPATASIVLFENERLAPFGLGWSAAHLLPYSDRTNFTDETGTIHVPITQEELYNLPLPLEDYCWASDWYIDKDYTTTDAIGWSYGLTWWMLSLRLRQDASVADPSMAFVRRRKWVRHLNGQAGNLPAATDHYHKSAKRLKFSSQNFDQKEEEGTTQISQNNNTRYFTNNIAITAMCAQSRGVCADFTCADTYRDDEVIHGLSETNSASHTMPPVIAYKENLTVRESVATQARRAIHLAESMLKEQPLQMRAWFHAAAIYLEIVGELGNDSDLDPHRVRSLARTASHLRENCVFEFSQQVESRYELPHDIVLGRGSYGEVRLAQHKMTKLQYACKFVSINTNENAIVEKLHAEISAMRNLDHPNILKLHEVYYSPRNSVCLVMELCTGGELFELVNNTKRPILYGTDETEIKDTFCLSGQRDTCAEIFHPIIFMRQMCSAICYIHENGIMHRDLKLENWLIEAQHSWRLKLIDFGLARHFRPGEKVSGTVGSLFYIAPEVLIPNSLYDFRCDLWSLGVIAYMLVSGAPPFWGDCDAEIRHHILAGAYDFPKHFFGGVSDAARDFISRLLQREPSMRLTARQALAHDWLIIQNPNHTHLLGGVEKTNNIFSLVAKSILHFSKLSKFQQLLLNVAAYELEPSAIAQPRTIFEFLDSDHSGTLNFNEFLYIFSQTETQFINLNDLFTMINFSNSKNIHFTEFLAVVAWQFNSFDFDTSRLERIFSLIADTKKEQIVISSLATLSGIDCEIRLSQPLTYTHLLNIWHDAMLTLQGGADFDDASVTTTTNSMIPSSSPNRESLSSIPPDDDLYFNTNLTPSSRPRTPPTPISTPRSARRAYSQQHRPAPSNNQLPPKILVHQSPPSPTFIPTSTTLVSSSG